MFMFHFPHFLLVLSFLGSLKNYDLIKFIQIKTLLVDDLLFDFISKQKDSTVNYLLSAISLFLYFFPNGLFAFMSSCIFICFSKLLRTSPTFSWATMYFPTHLSTQVLSPTCKSPSLCFTTHFLKHIFAILLNISVITSASIFATVRGLGPELWPPPKNEAISSSRDIQKQRFKI